MAITDTVSRSEEALSEVDDDRHVESSERSPTDGDSEDTTPSHRRLPRRIAISLYSAVLTLVIGVLVAAIGVLGWLYIDARGDLTAQERSAAEANRAEEVAMDYAVSAAQMDYQDFNAWKINLVDGTSPELKDKLTKAADSMQQILAPLQWKSTAQPLTAKVRSDVGGIYVVDAFVSVLTKTMQAPDGLQSTATYAITMDGRNDWQITDVGGIDAALGK